MRSLAFSLTDSQRRSYRPYSLRRSSHCFSLQSSRQSVWPSYLPTYLPSFSPSSSFVRQRPGHVCPFSDQTQREIDVYLPRFYKRARSRLVLRGRKFRRSIGYRIRITHRRTLIYLAFLPLTVMLQRGAIVVSHTSLYIHLDNTSRTFSFSPINPAYTRACPSGVVPEALGFVIYGVPRAAQRNYINIHQRPANVSVFYSDTPYVIPIVSFNVTLIINSSFFSLPLVER